MYAMVCSHPDLSYAVNAVSRYMANPDREHWIVVQWISNTRQALLILAYILGELEMESLGMWILIMLETLIKEDHLQRMFLSMVVMLSVEKTLYRIQLCYLLLRLSIWQLPKLVRNLFC